MDEPGRGPHEFMIAGDNCRLAVRLLRYEMPTITSGEDADWVTAEVEMTAGAEGTFTAKRGVSVFAPDLTAFLDQAEELLKTLSGEAALENLEDEFGCRIVLQAGRGDLSAFVREHVGGALSVSEAKTDQSYLQETVSQLRRAVAAFPTRGE